MSFYIGYLLLAMMVCLEAEGEPFQGKVGVAYVAVNRSEQWGQPLTQVIMAPNQFGGWRRVERLERLAPRTWLDCKRAALVVMDRTTPDPSFGAVHFLSNRDLQRPPAWIQRVRITTKIGRHTFYK